MINRFLLAVLLLSMAAICLAQGLPGTIPSGDATSTLLNLIMNGKNMNGVVLGGFVVILLVQILKAPLFGGFFERHQKEQQYILLGLGFLYSVIYNLSLSESGLNFQTVLSSLVISVGSTNFSQGLYEMFKNLFGKANK